jgi:hypothetical protein
MPAWLRRIESTVPCMPWRVIFPSSSSAWKALESCSSCVPCTQLDMIRGPKVCLWYKRLCLVHCLCRYPCPNCLRCPPPFGVAAFLPFFLNLHPAGLPLAFHCLLTFLPSSVTDPRLHLTMRGGRAMMGEPMRSVPTHFWPLADCCRGTDKLKQRSFDPHSMATSIALHCLMGN